MIKYLVKRAVYDNLYARARLGGVGNKEKISWVLSYVQGGVAET